MTRVEPELRSSETYTEADFLRVHTAPTDRQPETAGRRVVTIEHLCYRAGGAAAGGWRCVTIVDGEEMSREDALFIAQCYARQNAVPVVYESHAG